MNRNLLAVLFLAASIQINAQLALEKKVPKQATFVLSFNLNTLSQKVNFNDLGNYNFLKKPENGDYLRPYIAMKELFRLPDKAGINKTGKIYIFPQKHDSINNLTYLVALSDAKAFETRITDILKTKTKEPKFNKEGKLKVLTYEHQMSISIAKDYVIISVWDMPYYNTSDYTEYDIEKNKVVQIIDSIRYAGIPMDTTAIEFEDTPVDTVIVDEAVPEEPEDAPASVVEYSDSMGMVMDEEIYYDNSYDNDSLMKQFERRWAAKQKLAEEQFWIKHDLKMTRHQKKIYEIKPLEGMAANAEFAKVFANADDIVDRKSVV